MYCLSNNYHSNMAPKYLRVFKESGETGADISLRSILANSTPEYDSSETESSVTLSFVVPYSSISEPTAAIKYFKIYSKDNINTPSKPSAMITLKNSINISANSNLLVAWKMTISNN